MRKRRSNRSAHPARLDQTVTLFYLRQASGDWLDWEYRTVTLRIAQRLVARGEAEAVTLKSKDNGEFTGYRETEQAAAANGSSPASLTEETMHAVAINQPGVVLDARQRGEVVRFRLWPLLGADNRAVRVSPRMSATDLSKANALLDQERDRAARQARESERSEIRTWRPEPAETVVSA